MARNSGCSSKWLAAAALLSVVCATAAQAQSTASCAEAPEQTAASYNYILGTQAIGARYHFGEDSPLLEQAREIRGLGSNLLKLSLGRGSAEGYQTTRAARRASTVLEYIEASPDLQQALDMDFTYYQAWVQSFGNGDWHDGVDRNEARAYYSEMYRLAEWLLTRYSGSGKTFLLGNWEGDWLLHGRGNRDATPSPTAVRGMIDWLNIRQQAIDDAKAAVPHQGVELYHYAEVNLVEKAMRGEVSMASSVLPEIEVDLVSYSSYEAINGSQTPDLEAIRQPLTETLDYLEGQLRPRAGLPFSRRVFLGEFGYRADASRPQSVRSQFLKSRYVMQVALELDLPFALIWQFYNNEYAPDGTSRQMSMIDESGQRRALYYLYSQYFAAMNTFVTDACRQTGAAPTRAEFRARALELLPTLTFEDMQALAQQQ